MALAIVNSISARHAVLADAAASGAMAALFIAGSGIVAQMTGLPAGFLFWVGVAFLPWVAALALIGRAEPPAAGAVEAVVAGNALWVVASIAVLVLRVFDLNAFGVAFVVAQAIVVAILAELQFLGLRRAG
ncbi:hypothetical protein [uncultured Parvibaculum sp.]|uniref:hypothetical protein n=1 Tax=uncultured Parvibaculum sp. TaxID=291828 RepID=UPI0030ED8849|tara:strand:- start:1189 stop:1581 length:393 start_codon:yes stop_codon:yes gene_type:complete